MIPDAHGGRLVDRVLRSPERERRLEELSELPQVAPFIDQVYDAEKIALGAYSPLNGFVDEPNLESILRRARLTNDLPWPIPILFAPNGSGAGSIPSPVGPGDTVALVEPGGTPFALFHLDGRFRIDRKEIAARTYGTADPNHPNVADILRAGDVAYSGTIDLLRRLAVPAGRFELAPAETRVEFQKRGWKGVAGYQCRNPPHTAHEYLQRCTLDREDVDGLLIHPVVGRLKKGDYRPEVILESYEQLVTHYYPAHRVLLSSLSVTMRYGGPKTALFYGIVRKNYGCSHYIVGRDQSGVGSYYDPYACHRIFDEFDIGVTPLRYEETFFCRVCGWMATPKTCAHPESSRVSTSQTRIRKTLEDGGELPTEIIRPEVARILSRGNVIDND